MTACRICQAEFVRARPMQAVCSLRCAKKVPKANHKARASSLIEYAQAFAAQHEVNA